MEPIEDNLASLNVRYLLWSENPKTEAWPKALQSRLPTWSSEKRLKLLRGENPGPEGMRELAQTFSLPEEELRWQDLLGEGKVNVLVENLSLLLNSLERGGKKELADKLGIAQTTISRWLNGSTEPQRPTLEKLVRYFGLPYRTDLKAEPLFLSIQLLSDQAKKSWLKDRIDLLSREDLRDLFPALKRLLEER